MIKNIQAFRFSINGFLSIILIFMILSSCGEPEKKTEYLATLMTADPGHFHAALVQKQMYKQVNPEVYIYAPVGPDVVDHINKIEAYNDREENPTSWHINGYTGPDFFSRLLDEKPGNVLVLAGNNQKKTEYIHQAVAQGINVFSDKPMAINILDFEELKEAFKIAKQKDVLLYDIMTERFEITSLLQKKLVNSPSVFGELEQGSPDNPTVIKESVHHFFKYVSGEEIKRPAWFFDVEQEGDGIVDVTTHLVDLVQWACYPERILDYKKDIELERASRWPTRLNSDEFNSVTRLSEFPEYLEKDLNKDSLLEVYCNGEIVYKLIDVFARVKVEWKFKAPEGAGDTHFSLMRGTLANLEIRQGARENYKPELYVLPHKNDDIWKVSLREWITEQNSEYPGLELESLGDVYRIIIPEKFRIGHEGHFGQVTEKFLEYLKDGKLPDWEVPNMIAKYYTTTAAFELAKK